MEDGLIPKNKFPKLRKQAEKKLEKGLKDVKELAHLSAEARDRMLHEMLVHKIELEIQNEELRNAQLEIEASRNRYSDLYDFSPVGYITTSEEGLILEANVTIAVMLGVDKSVMVKEPFHRFIARDFQDVYYLHKKKLFEEKTRQICELKLIKKDGNQFYAQLESILVEDAARDVVQIRTAVIDISDRKQMEEEKKSFESQIRQSHKMEGVGTLAGGIAHTFNNILSIILGNLELALDDIPDENPVRVGLDKSRIACLQAKDTILQLLAYSHQSEKKKSLVKCIPIIKETTKLLRALIPKSIDIRQNIPEMSDMILADPNQINQLILNLCTNAAHAMPDGGILEISLKNVEFDKDTKIQYHKLTHGRYVKLTVSDTGQGIKSEIRDRIFDPYFTTKKVGEGTGLGLSIVYGIVKDAGGVISVESKPGKGARFDIFFPVIESEPAPDAKIVEEPIAGNERILFVDDEEPIVEIGSKILERLGYKVTGATRPHEALDLLRLGPNQFDLVVTDLTMPNMTGDKLTQEILKIRPNMPIILCTGFTEKMNDESAEKFGFTTYLGKPYQGRDLALTVRKVLDGK
ncbi:MAG: ATP-binding protein [Desulfobacterales bacterium]